MFLTLVLNGEERVFDSCVGPQMGKLSLAEYVGTAVEKGTENELHAQLKSPGPGTVGVIESGSGVTSLKTLALFVKPVAMADLKTPLKDLNLLQRMQRRFQPLGDLRDVGVNVTTNAVIATYTFLPKDESLERDGLVNINIFRFKTAIDADEAYGLRRAATKSGTDLVHREPKSTEPRAINDDREVITLDDVAGLTSSFRMFEYVPETRTAYFLVTVESQFKSDSLLVSYWKLIRDGVLTEQVPMNMTTRLEDALKLPDIDVLLGGMISHYVGVRVSKPFIVIQC